MTWKQRQAQGKCEHGQCDSPRVEHTDYCERHLEDKRERNRVHMRQVRMWKRLQLGLGL